LSDKCVIGPGDEHEDTLVLSGAGS
jgi:hypothetical protein